MKIFVTGVNGQLGHDVMNELHKRGHEGIGSDIADIYAGVDDGSPVTSMPYISLDITDKYAAIETITEIKPDAVIHCAAWTAVDIAEDEHISFYSTILWYTRMMYGYRKKIIFYTERS